MISDLLRLALELRRDWLDLPQDPGAPSLSFSDADVVLLAVLLDAFKTTSVVATDRHLYDRLDQVVQGSALAKVAGIDLSLDECPASGTSIMLLPVARIADPDIIAAAGRDDRVIAVYGWASGWSPSAWASADWPRHLSLKPTACLSPALWRSGIHILSAPSRAEPIQAGLDRVTSVFNDRYLDTCTLLEQVQKLEENLRGRSTSLLTKVPEQAEVPVKESDQIRDLKHTIEELQRTVSLLQHGLAFAHTEITRAVDAT